MPVVALVAVAAGIVWGAIYARRGSLALGLAALVLVAYVLGHPFWHVKVGPIPVTLDRLLLVGLLAMFAMQWRVGQLERKPLCGSDWLVGGLLALLGVSLALSGTPDVVDNNVASPTWRFAMSFLVPALLYWMARQMSLTQRELQGVLIAMTVLGVYLGFTALAEVSKQWAFVFPRYISDPKLGIHFGRARGPELNSASLGVYLTACLCCAWTLRGQVGRGWQFLLLATLPLMALGVFCTYTRSTWIGLVASAAVIGFFEVPRRFRWPMVAMALLVAILFSAIAGSDLVELRREGTAEDSSHSVDQRKSFAYVSWQMFKENPLFGVGFGRFYDQKLPYLSDRSQEFELESLRPLHHHNTLLSLLTETGMLGLSAFVGLVAAWGRAAWMLAKRVDLPTWVREQGVLMLAVLALYLSSAVFHDLTLLPSQEWLVFLFAGLTVNLSLAARKPVVESMARVPIFNPPAHAAAP